MSPSQLDAEFKKSFGKAVISRTDFRPRWNADLINAAIVIKPLKTEEETYRFIWDQGVSICKWLVRVRDCFGKEDNFQVIVAWDESIRTSGRHVLKIRGDIEALIRATACASREEAIKAGVSVQDFRGWSKNVFGQN